MRIGVAIGEKVFALDIPGRVVLEARRELRTGAEPEAIGLSVLALSTPATAALALVLYLRRGSLAAMAGEALEALTAQQDAHGALLHALYLVAALQAPHAPPALVAEAPREAAEVPDGYGPGYGPRPKKETAAEGVAPGEG